MTTAVLVAALVTTGWMAGLYTAFSYAVMPGLARVDDRSYVAVMQQVNAAILNPWFALGFVGALVLGVVATFLTAGTDAFGWTLLGVLLYLGTLLVTFVVNVPLNNALDSAGDAARMPDPDAVRGRFERRWVRWNAVRAVLATAALAALGMAAIRSAG
jgi:uncharacterized membrane protein